MPTPRKNAEVIKAWADGADVQYQRRDGSWVDSANPAFYAESCLLRVKPAAPKWPQTTMDDDTHREVFLTSRLWSDIANDVIAHACETGLVVPAATVDKMKLQSDDTEKQLLAALQGGIKRELGDMLDAAVTAVHELDPHRKVPVPAPKPTIYLHGFRPAALRIKEQAEERDMTIAINVRAACIAKYPVQVTNDYLLTLIALVK